MAPSLTIGYNGRHPFADVHLTDRPSVQQLLRTLLDPLEPFFSPNKARVRVPGATAVRFDQTASEVEGICRPLWGLACLLAGDGDYKAKTWWFDGIKAGTDPENPEYWHLPRDNDQRMVEMCPLGKRTPSRHRVVGKCITDIAPQGFALAVVPEIWDSMSANERTNVENWLGNSINEKK